MDANQYRAALKRLGLSQAAAARFLGVSSPTARRWAAGAPIPRSVELALVATIANYWLPADWDYLNQDIKDCLASLSADGDDQA